MSVTTDPDIIKLNTPKNTSTKSFVKNILLTPSYVEQLAANQQTIAAKGS